MPRVSLYCAVGGCRGGVDTWQWAAVPVGKAPAAPVAKAAAGTTEITAPTLAVTYRGMRRSVLGALWVRHVARGSGQQFVEAEPIGPHSAYPQEAVGGNERGQAPNLAPGSAHNHDPAALSRRLIGIYCRINTSCSNCCSRGLLQEITAGILIHIYKKSTARALSTAFASSSSSFSSPCGSVAS